MTGSIPIFYELGFLLSFINNIFISRENGAIEDA